MKRFRPGIVPTLVVALLLPMLVSLGFWQLSRGAEKSALLQSYAERRDCLVECLKRHFGDVVISGSECGMHIAWHLAEALPRAADLQAMAAEHGVGIYTLQSGAACDFGGCAYSERAIMLGFSSLNERQIRSGIERIAAAVDAARNPANAMASPRRPLPTVSRAHTRPPLANS